MPRNIGEGVSRDLTQEMGNWNPIDEDQESQDEKKRLNEAGGGIETGEKYKSVKKRGVVVGMEKVPGEIKKGPAPEAESRELNPEEKMILSESAETESVMGDLDQKSVEAAQNDIAAERQARRDAEKAAGWSPATSGEAANEPMVSKAPETEGMRKAAAVEAGLANRRVDDRADQKGVSPKKKKSFIETFREIFQ
jgi:hypothetical protein